jgi:uncharacterized protein YciI
MGFIEETGAAQYYRDAKILTIYEGTTAIQANDLVGRKTVRDGGAVAGALVAAVRDTAGKLQQAQGERAGELQAIGARLMVAANALGQVVEYVVANAKTDVKGVYAGSVPYLMLAGIVLGGWQMGRAAMAADANLDEGKGNADFLQAKLVTARFFADHFLTRADGMAQAIVDGHASVQALPENAF